MTYHPCGTSPFFAMKVDMSRFQIRFEFQRTTLWEQL
jgi:hypothetical protein